MRRARTVVLAAAVAVLAARGGEAANFNDVLPGARPMGMGMAYTAVADDAYAVFYNPAGTAGAEFVQAAASVGRMLSPVGALSLVAVGYTRPFPLRAGATAGAAFLNLRQNNGGDKDEFLLHYAEPVNLPQLYLSRPLKVGGNVKFISVDGSKGNKFGLGLDAGVLAESNAGLKAGASLTDLTPDLGVPNPSLNLGISYLLKDWLILASDLRVRRSLAQFFPGLEASFYQGLLKARLGKGLPLDGVSQVAFGVGVNFSPVILDWAMTVPFSGFNRPGGAYQLSVQYRFGAPPFYGRFVGTAARQAEGLRSELAELEDKRRTLQAQTEAAQADRDATQGQLKAAEGRLKEAEQRLRDLEIRSERKAFELFKPKPRPSAPAVKPPEPFPRQHKVLPGETLRSIAAQHYGDPNLWERVYEANRDKVERGLPQEGAVLKIPGPEPGSR